MKPMMFVISLSIFGASESPNAPEQPRAPTSLRALDQATSQALRAEATAEAVTAHREAVLKLIELNQILNGDQRLPRSPSLRRLRAKIRHRLRSVKSQLVRESRDDAQVASPHGSTGAAGGRAQRGDNADELIALIQATICPDTWEVNGGPSSIAYFAPRHALVIRAPSEVHSDARRLLIDLRRAGN